MKRREGRLWRHAPMAMAFLAALGMAGCSLYIGDDGGKDAECEPEGPGFPGVEPPERPLENMGPTTQAPDPPPPISGGTLAMTADEQIVVAADSDRDQVYIVSMLERTLVATVALEDDDEPGRVAIDDAGRAHVALRRGGGIVSIDIGTGEIVQRNPVCAATRGVSFDAERRLLYVSCHGGEVLVLDPSTGLVIDQTKLEVGLRDVLADDRFVYVSVFRTADVVVLDPNTLEEVVRMRPPVLESRVFDPETGKEDIVELEPTVAWRMHPQQGGGVVLLHQRARDGEVKVSRGGYGGDPCGGGIISGGITQMRVGEPIRRGQTLHNMVLPVDFALFNEHTEAIVVAAGNSPEGFSFVPPVSRIPIGFDSEPGDCFVGEPLDTWNVGGPPTAVVSSGGGGFARPVAVQLREPARLVIFDDGQAWDPDVIDLSQQTRRDTGHEIFHMDSGAGISCASCHPEGGDDARTWTFKCIGPRRTQSLQFGLLGTEPFHWDGDMDSMNTLMSEVFVGRMTGGQPRTDQIEALAQWLDKQQPPPRSPPADIEAVARGRELFESPAVGCATCHSGSKLTNNLSYDVGTGGSFQVPPLVGIADRAPFIHDGCAPTLKDRFTDPTCGGGDSHGVVSNLSDQQIDDLVAYLETL